MRSLVLVPGGLLAACAATAPPPAPEIPVRGAGSGYVCRQQAFEEFIGQVATSEVGAAMLRASGARTIRWVRQGMRITMEYSEERLTVRLDPNNRIITASCG
jgi:hypothetical protein